MVVYVSSLKVQCEVLSFPEATAFYSGGQHKLYMWRFLLNEKSVENTDFTIV